MLESNGLLGTVVASMVDAVVAADRDGRIIFWNGGATAMFGRQREEVMGQPVTILMPERFHDPHTIGLQRYLGGADPHVIGEAVELFGVRADGSEFPLELRLGTSGVGDEILFTAVIRDVTERVAAREQLQRSHDALERFIAVATHDLSRPLQTIVIEAQKMLTLTDQLLEDWRARKHAG